MLPGLFVLALLVFADAPAIAVFGLAGTAAVLVAIGVRSGRLRSVGAAGVVVLSAFVADVLWWNGWEPFDRDRTEGEAIALTPLVVLALPIPMLLIALGVGARVAYTRRKSVDTKS